MLPLKEATGMKHKQAEKMPFNIRMFEGTLSKIEYLLYLHQQLRIFQIIESKGVLYTYLSRTDRIQDDIEELKSQGVVSNSLLSSTKIYVDYLSSLSFEEILPHIYLNYMAIMFGGQLMKKKVPSTGRMYDFDNIQECLTSIRNVQKNEWAEEVNKGFDFIIMIFSELETESNKSKINTSN